jgi:hypothetical protein
MAMAYDARRLTRDVDAMFVPHGVVRGEADDVAEEQGLEPWWLNALASAYVSTVAGPGRRRVFDHLGVRVSAASPEHVFVMKALAERTRDVDDLRTLAALANGSSMDEATELCQQSFPTEPVSPRTVAVHRDSFA